ncbi:hypothetical protein KIPB_010606, partial [Kipferlia bialata]|eukprot:g10606.t1
MAVGEMPRTSVDDADPDDDHEGPESVEPGVDAAVCTQERHLLIQGPGSVYALTAFVVNILVVLVMRVVLFPPRSGV